MTRLDGIGRPDPLALNRRTLFINPEPDGIPDVGELTSFGPTVFSGSPGTIPDSDLRAISALTAPSHLISSSSLGAQSRSVRLVVTILNKLVRCDSSSPPGENVGDGTGGEAMAAFCRCAVILYSKASRISETRNRAWGFVSCNKTEGLR